MKKNGLLKGLILALQGAIVGTGAILPGVSGGVLCVAFGIYEPMMALLSHPLKSFKVYYRMFIPFLIGWLLGFTLLANVVEAMFNASASVALMLFFGLICGTLPELIKESERSDAHRSWTPFVLSLSLAYFLFCLLERGTAAQVQTSAISFVICGLVWGLSLIIPGLSSSSVLLYMGLYEPMTAGIAALDFSVILPLLLGLAITVITLARFVNNLFEKHYALVSRFILGFVIASSLKIVPTEFAGAGSLILSLVCFAAGFAVARYMDCAKAKQQGAQQ
ncbi:MAG: DUF368 domain-containing protein [Clostridia bacterium]|nr:DUF368 domain-containing protein [Clostridia bacterium]